MNFNFLPGVQNAQAAHNNSKGGGNAFHAAGSPAELAAFKAGQTIHGEVMAVRHNEVILRLEDGGQVRASLTKEIPLNVGQTMTFEVKSNNGSHLSISPLFENMGHDPNALKALYAASMPVSKRNLEMVSMLMRQGLPIDKNSLLDFNRQMAVNPRTNLLVLAQMNRLQISTTPENVRQFEAFRNHEHQISYAVRDLTDGLIKEIGQMITSGDKDGAAALFKNVLTIFDPNDSLANVNLQGNMSAKMTVNPIPMITGDDIIRMIGEQENQKTPPVPNITVTQGGPVQIQADISGSSAYVDAVKILENLILEKQSILNQDAANVNTAHPAGTANAANAANTVPVTVEPEILFLSLMELKSENREQLALLMREAGFSGALTNMVNTGNVNTASLLSLINQELSASAGHFHMDKLFELITNKDFQAVMKHDINSQWLLRPEDLAKDKQVQEHFQRIFEQTAKLVEVLQASGRGESPVASAANNLSNNINFINQLNQMFTYIQIPLKMGGENAHGELLIYTNKKNLSRNDGNVSALLHLDMEHLGTLDVYIAMENNKVATKFYMENDDALNVTGKHIHILNERLQERGYRASTEFIARETDINPVDEILDAAASALPFSKFSFDARA